MIHIEELCPDTAFSEESRNLSVSDESPTAYKIFRLFTGMVKISCEITSRTCEISNDTIALCYSRSHDDFITKIASYVIEEEDVDSVEWLSNEVSKQRLKYRNIQYFRELYDELCNYYFAVNDNNYVAAFVHEYRMIEYIAYAYPLIYAVRSNDFYMTFGHLKNFVSNQGKGELSFFQSAINKIFADDILSTSFDISLESISNENVKNIYCEILRNYIKPEWLHTSTTDDLFAIKFNQVSSVLIELRNKIFHHSVNTHNNLLASRILDMNFFMKLITPTFFNWLSVVYLEVFKSILSFDSD